MRITPAQKRIITDALGTHGVIVFGGTYSAYQQQKIVTRMEAAGLVVPGTRNITSQAVRAAAPAALNALHVEAHTVNDTTGGLRLEDVKAGDVITVRTFSTRSGKCVTRRVRVWSCYVHNGYLMMQGVYVNKNGSRSRVQPRFGNMPMVTVDALMAVNA